MSDLPNDLEPVSDTPNDLVPVDFAGKRPTHKNFESFLHLYQGIDKVGDSPELNYLSENSKDPNEAKSRAVNQFYLQSKLHDFSEEAIQQNWENIKVAYAKHQFGLDVKSITDTQFYSHIAKDIQAEDEVKFGSLKPHDWTFVDTFRARTDVQQAQIHLSAFWKSINKPLIELPEAPKDLPNIPSFGISNPALTGGIYNGLKPLIEGFTSPVGVATVGTGALLTKLSAVYPAARMALTSMSGVFAGIMAKQTVASIESGHEIFTDPNTSMQDKITAGTEIVANTGATLLGVIGVAMDHMPASRRAEFIESVKGKQPEQVAEMFRQEAYNVSQPELRSDFLNAARELDSIKVPGVDAPPEKVKAAAIKDESGKITEGPEHKQIDAKGEKGFVVVDDNGAERFADRKDAMKVAEKSGQLIEGKAEGESLRSHMVDMPVKAEPPEIPENLIGIKNEAVDAELAKMGMDPATHGEKLAFKEAMQDASSKMASDPRAGEKLLDELSENPRPVTGKEDALLLQEQNRLRIERNAAEAELIEATKKNDSEAVAAANIRIAKARDAFQRASDIVTKVGTSNAQGLALRRMMIKEDYSLSAMERRRVAARGGKALDEAAAKEIRDLHQKLQETNKAFEDYLAKIKEGDVAPKRPPSTSRVTKYLSDQADAARERIKERMKQGRQSAGIDPGELADHVIIGADYIAKGLNKFSEWSKAMIEEFGDAIKPHLAKLYDDSLEARKDAARLGAFKTRTIRATEALNQRLASGDLSKPVRRPIPLDAEALRLKADYERVKRIVDLAEQAEQLKNRSIPVKTMDLMAKWTRAGALSYPTTLAKLTGAALIRLFTTPIEQGVGYGISKALPELAKRAPREGVPTIGGAVRAEARAYTEGIVHGLKGAADLLANRETDLSVLVEKAHLPDSALEYLGKIHGALKNVTKENEFYRSLELRSQHAIDSGIDPSDPIIQMRLINESYMDANRSIFLQDNIAVNAYKRALNSLEHADSMYGKALAGVAKIELPIVKVPSNVLAEASEIIGGTLTGSAKAAWAYAKGIENLKPVEADAIMRHLKKGFIGAALLAIGYFKWKDIGGYYEKGEKRKKGDVQAGEIRVGDAVVPKQLTHNPYISDALQFGATIGRVMNEEKKTKDENGFGSGLGAASIGLIEETPFFRETSTIERYLNPRTSDRAVSDKLASILVPGAFDWLAKQIDKEEPFNLSQSPVSRKPETLKESIESRIPWLRENVKRNIKTSHKK